MRARGGAYEDVLGFELERSVCCGRRGEMRCCTYCFQDAANVVVESIGFAVPVLDLQPAFGGFEGAGDVRVYPEWPECVVEVEDDDFR